jgi:hypothetical protein
MKRHHQKSVPLQARVIENFKNPSTRDAGNFPAVLRDQIFNHYARKSYSDGGPPPLTVADVNTILDDLVKAAAASGAATDDENRSMSRLDAQTAVLRPLMARATAVELYWICRLIFKDMKLGLSESTIFKAWHPDAQVRREKCVGIFLFLICVQKQEKFQFLCAGCIFMYLFFVPSWRSVVYVGYNPHEYGASIPN